MAKTRKNYGVSILPTLVVAAMAIAFVATNTSAQEYPSGMISYWKFDEGSGNTAYDSVGGNLGTIYGATRTTRQVDGALSFDGVDDYVNVSTSDAFNFSYGTGNFTISAWINPLAMPSFASGIIAKATELPYTGWGFYFYSDGRLGFGGLGFWEFTSPTNTINTNERAYVTAVKNGRSYKLYKNATEVASTTYGDLQTSTASLKIGRDYPDGSPDLFSFKGTIYEIAIYNRALTSPEIRQWYQAGLGGLAYKVRVKPDDVLVLAILYPFLF